MTTPTGEVRVLFLLLGDTAGPVMLMITDTVNPYNIRIVGLYGQDGSTTALLKEDGFAFQWIEDVVGDLGINLIADMVTSFPPPDLDAEFDGLDDWAAAAFRSVLGMGKLLLP